MFKRIFTGSLWSVSGGVSLRLATSALPLGFVFLLIEFFDELHYTVEGAALPLIRHDLALSYAEVGLFLGLPNILGTLIEPAIMLLGDTGLRKRLALGGGLVIVLSLLVFAGAGAFPAILVAAALASPASGAFVNLSQATLMDLNPGRETQSMARWTVAGSLGNLLGPLLLAGALALGLGWRPAFLALAGLALTLFLLLSARPFPKTRAKAGEEIHSQANTLKRLTGGLWSAVRGGQLLRWLLLMDFSDLLLDVLTSYIPLYLIDIGGFSPEQTSILLSVMLLSGLLSDLAVIPLLERIPGRKLVRISAGVALVVYPAFLLVQWPAAKIVLMALIRFTTLGWYPVLQGEAYAALPGRSATVNAIGALNMLGGIMFWFIGWFADRAGLPAAMWLLLLGPLVILLGMPRQRQGRIRGKLDA